MRPKKCSHLFLTGKLGNFFGKIRKIRKFDWEHEEKFSWRLGKSLLLLNIRKFPPQYSKISSSIFGNFFLRIPEEKTFVSDSELVLIIEYNKINDKNAPNCELLKSDEFYKNKVEIRLNLLKILFLVKYPSCLYGFCMLIKLCVYICLTWQYRQNKCLLDR